MFFLNMQSSSYLMVLKQTICVLIYEQTNPGPQVTVLSLMKVFMYQNNENCHETYLNMTY